MAGKIVSRHEASTECSPVSAGERQKRPVIVPVSGAMLDWLVSKQHLAAKNAIMMPQLSTPSSRLDLPRWALPHIPNHDDPTDQILFFDLTNRAPPAKATPRDALHHSGREPRRS